MRRPDSSLYFVIGSIIMLIFWAARESNAAVPDYSGAWNAKVSRVGKDTCRKSSRRNLQLTLKISRLNDRGKLRGVIAGNGKAIDIEGRSLATAFSLWRVTNYNAGRLGRCTKQEGVYVAGISNFKARKVNLNHNINCRTSSRHTYSCHYTYKGSAARQ